MRPAAPQQPSVSVAIPCALSTPRHGHYPELAAELFSVGIAVRDERLFLHLLLLLLVLLAPWGHHRLSSVARLAYSRARFPCSRGPPRRELRARNYLRSRRAPGAAAATAAAPCLRCAVARRATPRRATPRYAAERQRRTRRTVDVLSGRRDPRAERTADKGTTQFAAKCVFKDGSHVPPCVCHRASVPLCSLHACVARPLFLS